MDLTKDWYRSEFINHELLEEHRTLEKELSFYDAIVNGDIDFVTQNCDEKAFVNPEGMGKLSFLPAAVGILLGMRILYKISATIS